MPANNLRSSEKCFGTRNMSKIDFCCSCLLDFYVKTTQIDVFCLVIIAPLQLNVLWCSTQHTKKLILLVEHHMDVGHGADHQISPFYNHFRGPNVRYHNSELREPPRVLLWSYIPPPSMVTNWYMFGAHTPMYTRVTTNEM